MAGLVEPARRERGELLGCGWNLFSTLGLGPTSANSVWRLTTVPTPASVRQVACGSDHTCALTVDGAILTCGRNTYGQLGLNGVPFGYGEAAKVHELRPVALPSDAAHVACGDEQTLAVTVAGTLFGWGKNEDGQLGLGHRQEQSLPQPVPLPAGALRVAGVGSSASLDNFVLAVFG